MGVREWATSMERAASLIGGDLKLGVVPRSADTVNANVNATIDATADAATAAFIDELQWSAAKSIRTSLLTLASFNIIAAIVTILCALWDSYRAAKRKNPMLVLKDLRPSSVGAPQVYPLVLSVGVVVQGIMFAVAQAKGLEGLLARGCVSISQMMMAATFVVPFIQLIFGLETTLRSFPRYPFPCRPKWVVPICLFIILAGDIALYGVTLVFVPPDLCFASLFWFTQTWRPVCFGLFLGISVALLACLIAVFCRLRHGNVSSEIEKTAASHMVSYIAIAVISNALMTPFFFSITFGDAADSASYPMELSTVASIVANLSGIMTGGLYLFLRGRRAGPSSYERDTLYLDTKGFEMVGGSLARRQKARMNPPRHHSAYSMYSESEYSESRQSRWANDKMAQDMRSAFDLEDSSAEPTPRQTWMRRPTFMNRKQDLQEDDQSQAQRASSHFFSRPFSRYRKAAPSTILSTVPPPPTEADSILVPPPLFHKPETSWRNREPSVGSALVQIGLRISNMNDVSTTRTSNFDSAQATQHDSESSTHWPSFLGRREPVISQASHLRISSIGSMVETNKSLPNIPPESPARTEGTSSDVTQLTSAVYSPQKQAAPRVRLASPKGVGFQTAPGDRKGGRTPLPTPKANVATEKGGWI